MIEIRNTSAITKHPDHYLDASGNTSYFSYFGSEERALKAIESLKDCENCRNCSDCSGCSRCSGCLGCSDCSRLVNQTIDVWSASVPNLNQRVYEAVQGDGALNTSSWHSCETTHCWAGWIVTLAGQAGKALERQTSTEFAAMKIYHNSTGERISPVYFYFGNVEAMAKIKELAEK